MQKIVLQIVFDKRCIEREPTAWSPRDINLSEKLDFLAVWFQQGACRRLLKPSQLFP